MGWVGGRLDTRGDTLHETLYTTHDTLHTTHYTPQGAVEATVLHRTPAIDGEEEGCTCLEAQRLLEQGWLGAHRSIQVFP